jgi:hypothetical protein
MRRARRNPSGSVGWGWLAAGSVVGAVGFIGYSMYQRPAAAGTMPTVDVASNGIGGAGAGLIVAGLAGGVARKSLSTAAIGVVAGVVALTVGMTMNTGVAA